MKPLLLVGFRCRIGHDISNTPNSVAPELPALSRSHRRAMNVCRVLANIYCGSTVRKCFSKKILGERERWIVQAIFGIGPMTAEAAVPDCLY
ncbi:MAG TPA: hypothetical protein VN541_19055 [Tepidisphaeraceae bacterium]|nr:hypothetical protein [Tepidisphaeraceae bacterium]